LMHKTDFAPVLSATSNRDSVWIISIFPNLYQSLQLLPAAGTSISLGPVIRAANHLLRLSWGRYFA
jgi:hypothetical protein